MIWWLVLVVPFLFWSVSVFPASRGTGIYCPMDTITCSQIVVFLSAAFLNQPAFQTTLKLKDSNDTIRNEFSAGEDITLEITVTNLMNSPRALTLPTGKRYDFIVGGDSGAVWNWSYYKRFTSAVTELQFGPLEAKTFREVWNQTDNAGVQVQPGTYQAQCFIAIGREEINLELSPDSQTRSPAVTFTIK